MHKTLLSLALGAAISLAASAAWADTLADIKARGFLRCGVTEGTPGFSVTDAANEWTGLDVDYCRALASAIFNDPKAVRFTATTSENRWKTLSAGEIDVLSRTSTWTMTRDTTLGIRFAGTLYYDGQAFMVRRSSGYKSALELSGASICVETGTTTELNAADYFAANGMEYNPMPFVSQSETLKAFEDKTCDVITSGASALTGSRLEFAVPDDYLILPEIIAKEPLALAVRQGDDNWFNIVRWTYYALLEAEEDGVTQANVDEMLGSDSPAIKRLLGLEGDFGSPLGLTKDWAYQIIKGVGNYAELFDRNVGKGSAIGLDRGLNALWKDGGLQYSPPIR